MTPMAAPITRLIERVNAEPRLIAPGIEAIEGIFPDGLLAIQTHREGGVSLAPFDRFNLGDHVGDDPSAVGRNRQRLEKLCATNPTWLNQSHGIAVVNLDVLEPGPGPGHPPQADASVTTLPGRGCAVLTADCLPILVARQGSSACGAIHAGWRGLCGGVIEATLSAMFKANPKPDRWCFWLGPCIGPNAFEVGEDVRLAFVREDPNAGSAFVPRADLNDKYLADLRLLAEQRILRWFSSRPDAVLTVGSLGLGGSPAADRPIRIARSNACTFHERQRYFSYRRDRCTGRMASVIGYKPI